MDEPDLFDEWVDTLDTPEFAAWKEQRRRDARYQRWMNFGIGTIIVTLSATWIITWIQLTT